MSAPSNKLARRGALGAGALGALVLGLAWTVAPTAAIGEGKDVHAEEARNHAAFKLIVEDGLNRHRLEVVDQVFAANMIDHDLPPGTPPGPAGSKAKIGAFLAAFPDIHFTFEAEIASGDKIAGRGYFTGTHKGTFNGIPATGKRVLVRFMDNWRFEGGKVVEYWGQPDVMGLLAQLGVGPGAAAAAPAGPTAGHNEVGTAFMKALRDNNVDAIVGLYAEDATYFPTDALAVKGRSAIRASFAGFLGAFTVKDAYSTEVMHLTRGDYSVSWGRWGGTLVPKAGGAPFKFEGRFTDVSKLVAGRWTYVLDHASLPAVQK